MSLLSMVAGLTRGKVAFVVVGGLAMRAHGSFRITEDLDVCYDPDDENVRRLADVLGGWHAYLRGVEPGLPWVMDARAFRTTPVMMLVTDHGSIDVMDRVLGVGGYHDVAANSVETRSEGTTFRALDLPALVRAKRATGRAKDKAQLPELEALLALRRRK